MNPSQSPELETLRRVTERLDQAKIPHMLTGSMAMNFYGHARATNDFDIVVEIRPSDSEKVIRLFEKDFYISPETVIQAVAQGGLFNIIDNRTVFKIDLIVRKPGAYSNEQFKRRRLEEFGGLKMFVISPEDLILAKLDWSRESLSEMQERDIQNLVRLLNDKLDRAYLKKWSGFLGVEERLGGYVSP